MPVHVVRSQATSESVTALRAMPVLPASSQVVMVTTGIAMGLLVYGLVWGWWGSSMGVWSLVATALLMGVFVAMGLVQWRDALWWQCCAVVALLLLGLNLSVWWLSGAQHQLATAWRYWQCGAALVLFIALAWVQALLQSRRWRAVRYSSLFAHGWNNAMVVGLVLQFVGVCWLVLALWGGLFALVKVGLFAQTFSQPLFVCLSTGAMAGVGVVLARGQPRALQVQLQLVLVFFKVLLPLLALVVVLFVLALPFTGVQPLWDTRKAAVLLVVLQLCVLVFVNAVYQDGLVEAAPYPRGVQGLVHAALLLWPVLGGLGVWAVWLRVQQYGWTYERVWAVVFTGMLLLYGLGYAWLALQRGRFLWLQGLGRFNAAMSWLWIALVVLLHTPLLDVLRLSAYSQQQRLLHGQAAWDVVHLQSLRFDHGRYGLPALQALALDARAQTPEMQQLLQQLLGATHKLHRAEMAALAEMPPRPVQDVLQLVSGQLSPPPDWWQAVDQGSLRHSVQACRSGQQPASEPGCVVLQLPLAERDALLPVVCRVQALSPSCWVFERDAQQHWQQVAQLSWGSVPKAQRAALVQAIRAGRLQVQPARWKELHVPGEALPVGRVR